MHARPWACSACSQTHQGLFDLAHDQPDAWPGGEELSPNTAVATSTHFLSEDFCVVEGEQYFVRCVLELPIIGAGDERFGFGVWSSLSKANFGLYVDSFDSGDQDDLGPWFGWFSNTLQGYRETFGLKCQVHPRGNRDRPLIELEPTDHPLAVEQRDGITFDRLLDIYALNGHDIRPALG
ncbi:MAG TPA: DUF2199 domain-containing protein [Vineibacter sp.]|nr:DUF2199 domain-containing protein [Vineibacter sp.]